MAIWELADLAWEEAAEVGGARTVAVLPVGAIEAHGPHLPLRTDGIIAAAMAREGARRLSHGGWDVLVLPPLHYSAAPFAAQFVGTISVSPETVTRLVQDIARSTAAMGARALAIANAHLDPTHLASLHAAAGAKGPVPIVFPDLTRKPWALRMGEEFRTGACHAGNYETSVVMAETPGLVREEERVRLPPVNRSLSAAIREGRSTFAEAGGERAYFGWPADASAEEGRARVEALGAILEEAVLGMIQPGEER